MASTRNKNTKEDYLLEQKMNKGRESYIHLQVKHMMINFFYLVQILLNYQEKLFLEIQLIRKVSFLE